MLKIVTDGADSGDLGGVLDELVTEGARRMLAAALQAEVADYIDRYAGQLDEAGHRVVVRNGTARERTLVTAAGGRRVRGGGIRMRMRPLGAPIATRLSRRELQNQHLF